jgi:FlaA1/EpsC-like NDP-sugar epimerase
MGKISSILFGLRNRHFLILDVAIFVLTPAAALLLRTDGVIDAQADLPSLLLFTFVFAAVKLAVYYASGMYSRYWRYASVEELGRITAAGMIVLVLQLGLFMFVLLPSGLVAEGFPRSIPLIDALLSVSLTGALRYSVRFTDRLTTKGQFNGNVERVVVAGAHWAGVTIVKEMQRNPHLGMLPVAFLDDDPATKGLTIGRVPVMGKCSDVASVLSDVQAHKVIIAMPTAPGKTIRRVVELCEQAGAQVKIIPGMYELLDGTVSVKQLRDVSIEDLLRRDPIRTDTTAVGQMICGKRVLITGAGGSIGSELCRQILRLRPASLVIMGHGENSIFEVQSELIRTFGSPTSGAAGHDGLPCPDIHPVIADTRALNRLWAVFTQYRPEVVFHAAAHKHVPLMELNPTEAVTNNIVGTRNLLHVSRVVGVERFVMVSTDKAVNPTSMMGASKRVAELLVHQMAKQTGNPYVAVRFGNVLGSRGSVLRTFQQQIADGGPVTVTHPEMKRYFMTIPEAVQLLLQAATLGSGGEVFMLDMGQPVKIVDLARDVIKLSGLEEGRDIEIAFTGMRPGEKLFEELLTTCENYRPTPHEKIRIAESFESALPGLLDLGVKRVEQAAARNDEEATYALLQALVPEFNPVRHSVSGNGRSVEELPAVSAMSIVSADQPSAHAL